MDAPFLLWSMTWKEGKELQATEEAKTKLLETIKTKGYVSIAVDAAVQEYLRRVLVTLKTQLAAARSYAHRHS